jgi:hypothetical protein
MTYDLAIILLELQNERYYYENIELFKEVEDEDK